MIVTTETTITITPPHGLFLPTSFSEHIGRQVRVQGLDHRYEHTLTGVQVADDGARATLTIQTRPPHRIEVQHYLAVLNDAPHANIRVVHADTGEQLAEARLHAPLAVGAEVLVAGDPHTVVEAGWPSRDPDTGASTADVDQQLVLVRPVLELPDVQFDLPAGS
ncbi:hypothetical protein [Kutzneria buriramensis]|uniref:Uncharacterized protein n=1 Tax=Kutzneria buriramensis TaxID=1045776 RepID=A0A3E0HF05_9PSEU|nr:hypothetical protein [Kutzneria buriramensis]REH43626.1 hypothetical protein BCF44_109169 [Kutzneria buriramensis]